jgi:hypothetical protein
MDLTIGTGSSSMSLLLLLLLPLSIKARLGFSDVNFSFMLLLEDLEPAGLPLFF